MVVPVTTSGADAVWNTSNVARVSLLGGLQADGHWAWSRTAGSAGGVAEDQEIAGRWVVWQWRRCAAGRHAWCARRSVAEAGAEVAGCEGGGFGEVRAGVDGLKSGFGGEGRATVPGECLADVAAEEMFGGLGAVLLGQGAFCSMVQVEMQRRASSWYWPLGQGRAPGSDRSMGPAGAAAVRGGASKERSRR